MQYHRKYIENAGKLFGLSLLYLTLLFPFSLSAQDEAAIRPIIKAGDLKTLEKADKYKDDADKLMEEANTLNMEVFSVQADPNLDEKAISKKTAQLESQAQQKQIEASALYEKCNELKFILYKEYIDEFWKAHDGEESNYINAKLLEEQASDNYFQATSYRIDAKQMDNKFAKVEKLTEANNLENDAIQKQLTALGMYHGIGESTPQETTPVSDYPVEAQEPPADAEAIYEAQQNVPPPVTSEQTIPAQIEINQSMIARYNQYISSGQFIDTTLSTGEIAGITTFDRDRMLQLWYDYIYGRGAIVSEPEFIAAIDTIQPASEELPSQPVSVQPSETMEIGIITDENKDQIVPADEEVIYRVQLAANRTQLSQRALSSMYYGNKSVEMINEAGWYKYSVGDFVTYEEASQFRQSSGMRNAFVVAYRKGARFVPASAVAGPDTTQIFVAAGEQTTPSGLIFRIQVAASRVPITVTQLKRIYDGNYPVEMTNEEGWYRYQFMGVRLYSDAAQIIRNVTTKGSFIVAYENGKKLNLAEAVRENNDLENDVKTNGRKGILNEIEYHVQLAASRIAMKDDELKALYNGSEPVALILEDGWYKYHLKAGNSSQMAEQLKQACGINKAFIVRYRRAAKITYYEATQETR